MSQQDEANPTPDALPFPSIRNIKASSPLCWFARAWGDLKACPIPSLFYGFCFAAMGLLITFVFEHAYEYTSGLTSGFLLLGPFVAGFNAVWNMFWLMSGKSPVFETGTLIHTFMVFLTFMFATIGLLAIAMRRYYALMPPNLKQVIRDLNGGA